ncbi:MAG: hypothetical protein IPP71_05705 [Bacteroidetes bacterium]|nr:hypothetical protein [Bacteroidota bacterium]
MSPKFPVVRPHPNNAAAAGNNQSSNNGYDLAQQIVGPTDNPITLEYGPITLYRNGTQIDQDCMAWMFCRRWHLPALSIQHIMLQKWCTNQLLWHPITTII